jgi:uncharacterized protein (DUF2235 family)
MRKVRMEINPEYKSLLDDLRKATLPRDKIIKSVSFERVAGQRQIEIHLEIPKKANIPLAAKWLYDLLDCRVWTLLVNRAEVTMKESEIAKALEFRNIILCSDGTGDAGGKTRGTNVWRLFNALDWHHSDEQVEQIAFYNDGVGTDNMRLLRLLGGAFGWGLKDNIRILYSVAARNYRPGDRLYLFGFSRGAFTVRELAGMITTCGLPSQEALRNARNPRQLVKWILRAYRGGSLLIWPFLFVARKITEARCKVTADTLRALEPRLKQMDEVRKKRKEQDELETKIKALQEKQDKLETRIKALQRTGSSPVEEIEELCAETKAREAEVKKEKEAAARIEREIAALQKQPSRPTNLLHCPAPIEFVGVWDTVDAVGIPNDEIRQVLRWVNERTSLLPRIWDFRDRDLSPDVARGVQALALDDERKTFHPNVWNRRTDVEQVWFAGAHSNVGGGNPKDGMAYVTLDWMMGKAATSGLRYREKAHEEVQANADVHGKLYDSRKGLGIFYRYTPRYLAALEEKAGKCKIHSSVFDRIRRGTAGYAPLTISADYEWVRTKIYSNDPDKPLSLPEGEQARLDYMTDLRKTLYTVFAWLSFFLVGIIGLIIVFPPATGGGWLWSWISQGFKAILPWFLDPVVDLVDYHYLLTGAFFLPFLLLWWASHSRRVAIGSLAAQAWRNVIDKWQTGASKSGKDDASKVIDQNKPKGIKPGEDDRRKWDLRRVVSKRVRTVTVSLFVIFLLSLILTALPFFYGELVPASSPPTSRAATASSRCSNAQGLCTLEPNGSILVSMDAKEKENRTELLMEAGERYTVEYVSRTNWCDGEIDVSPGGFDFDRWLGVRRFWWLEWLRPYPQGHWYQVLGRIGDSSPAFPLFKEHLSEPEAEDLSEPEEFKPLESGELYLFVNDLPYGNNSGTMTLRITRPE